MKTCKQDKRLFGEKPSIRSYLFSQLISKAETLKSELKEGRYSSGRLTVNSCSTPVACSLELVLTPRSASNNVRTSGVH